MERRRFTLHLEDSAPIKPPPQSSTQGTADPARPAEGQTDVSNTNQDESTAMLSSLELAPSTSVDRAALQHELHQSILCVDNNVPSEHMDLTGTDQPQGADQRTEPVSVMAPKPVGSGGSIIVSPRQRGNPILKFVRSVPWEFGEITPDYVLGQTTCALFLSLRYHSLNPDYIHDRLKLLGQTFTLRVLLVQVDVKDPHSLKELARMCILADCTLILAWSPEEAGRYLETYKSYEKKPADLLKEHVEKDYLSKVTDCLTTVRSINKTDSITLLSAFSSVKGIINASKEDLVLCPGLGPQKAKRLHDVLHQPFLKSKRKEG
ncbi:DNA excision repair protein ERCC-1 isoform X1 [Gadus morhua]|nr:DNA excision repair protein ERCC-1 isoform X1 [Gadus morhua]